MSSRGPDPLYGSIGDLREKAIGECGRAIQLARSQRSSDVDSSQQAAAVVAHAVFGLTNATLAVADRLDVLIGLLFDERRPLHVTEWDDNDNDNDDDGDRDVGEPGGGA